MQARPRTGLFIQQAILAAVASAGGILVCGTIVAWPQILCAAVLAGVMACALAAIARPDGALGDNPRSSARDSKRREQEQLVEMEQALQVAAALDRETASAHDMTGALDRREQAIAQDLAVAREAQTATERATLGAIEAASNLASLVRATTECAKQATQTAIWLADSASSAGRSIALSERRSAEIVFAADTLAAALQQAGDTQAGACRNALDEVLQSVTATRDDVATTIQRVGQIATLVQDQAELLSTVMQATTAQGEEAARLVALIQEAASGAETVRTRLASLSDHRAAQRVSLNSLQKTMARLPEHAAMVGFLAKGVPCYVPGPEDQKPNMWSSENPPASSINP